MCTRDVCVRVTPHLTLSFTHCLSSPTAHTLESLLVPEADVPTWVYVQTIAAEIARVKPHVVAIVHAETSTGVCQPLATVGDLCRAVDALLIVDSVSSLGAVPILVDEWKIDAAYSGGQKCLGVRACGG